MFVSPVAQLDQVVLLAQQLASLLNSGKSPVDELKQFADLSAKAAQTSNAELYFNLAILAEQSNNFKLAISHYKNARDHDLLRFRATTEINEIIKTSAAKHQAILVEYEHNLSGKSAHGIIGNKFMMEHLHPNLPGYFVLADSFYQALKTIPSLGNIDLTESSNM